MSEFGAPMGDFGFNNDNFGPGSGGGNFNGGVNSPQIPPGPPLQPQQQAPPPQVTGNYHLTTTKFLLMFCVSSCILFTV